MERIKLINDLAVMVRDVLLTGVLIICLGFPGGVRLFLDRTGLDELGLFGFTAKRREAKEDLAKTLTAVNAAAAARPDSVRGDGEVPPLSLVKSVEVAQRVAPELLRSSGWVFLGRVDENKLRWADRGPATIVPVAWPIPLNTVVVVKDNAYLRADSPGGSHAGATVLSVVTVGQTLQIVELDYSHARAGGFFVWAKVAVRSS